MVYIYFFFDWRETTFEETVVACLHIFLPVYGGKSAFPFQVELFAKWWHTFCQPILDTEQIFEWKKKDAHCKYSTMPFYTSLS